MARQAVSAAAAAAFTLALAGCQNKPTPTGSNPLASASASSAQKAAHTTSLVVDPSSSHVTFLMDSPLEKIHGELEAAISGTLDVDLEDLSHATGTIKVDLDKLSLSQEKRKDEKHDFAKLAKNDTQNHDAREWLQLDPHEGEIAEAQTKRNRFPEFKLERLENLSATNLGAVSGAERDIGASARGSFLLHGRTNRAQAKLALAFEYAGDQLQSVHVKTSEPFKIALEDYDVNPRGRAGKLLKTISEALAGELGKKVSRAVPIELEFTAKPVR